MGVVVRDVLWNTTGSTARAVLEKYKSHDAFEFKVLRLRKIKSTHSNPLLR